MRPPKPFKIDRRKDGYSVCIACGEWRQNNRFRHEGVYWILCLDDFEDYWFNTDKLLPDYRSF